MIHATAIVDPSAKIADSAEIGPYSVIGPDVVIGERTIVGPHVVIKGPTVIGEDNEIHQFASIGDIPQDLSFDKSSDTKLVIGDRNSIREYVSIHRAIPKEDYITKIGDDNMLMAHVHIGHNCILGNKIVIVNSTNLAGHVHINDWAIISGFSGIHQFCHVGAHTMLGIQSKVTQDIPPFVMYAESSPKTINARGLQRRGFDKQEIQNIRRAFKVIYRQELGQAEMLAKLDEMAKTSESVKLMADFIRNSPRGIAR
ncbi:acyl-ACP--UDP-N-acetylglucosamine O-acyltransferase [Aliikangiella marina]|uniref:Acyl-ACP--UDP-N-acetylglucosamine O-acyltransferase n=1 Tax=Aliikangiella marina TaxID=1712262 RepID=A0A545TDW2_9GAMM|nr:acyl-ACP--UDP-N-acetylglucosamine O-acyltransferase [Aliikangiella marina]TQV75409.1 acyl-ACP--UDP-N-acetylglucosamine O-acyltransferase [Aliikangiella marina]